ncbi:Hsp20/alpha crystallin family protein [uncultured Sunxiuqinia sp.]|uniref:Hsp20/alpha crystallin family protein n=1 Tax=uncultured Sunxiuqinia sp. TaxID=1573825 RepID=UPI00262E6AE1|nr:Hsp20/alpha crystallin family protein [uncultured Sunxiuqinia sp.]
MKLVNVNRPVYGINPVDALLNDFFNTNGASDRLEKKELTYSPSTNVLESDSKIVLELLVPGYSKNEIKIAIENNVLLVKSNLEEAKAKEPTDEKDAISYSRVEFRKREFEKKFKLSDKLNQDKIHAEVANGILTISLEKKQEAIPVKREIEIA